MRKSWLLLLIFALAILALGLAEAAPGLSDPGALESHAQIWINGDAGFIGANGVRSGTGTLNDPYIISNWDIDANGTSGIRIRQTFKHYRIINCRINNTSLANCAGILIDDTRGSIGQIWNCQIYGCAQYSIEFDIGNNCTVNDTLMNDTVGGFYFDRQCGNIDILRCEVRNITAMVMYQANAITRTITNMLVNHNRFENCTGGNGIAFIHNGQWYNTNITFSNNTFEDIDAVCISSFGNDIHVLYNNLTNCSRATLTNVITVDWFNGSVIGNYIHNGTEWVMGIGVRGDDNLISNNTIVNATYNGISVTDGADRTIVRGNIIRCNFWQTIDDEFGVGGINIFEAHNCIVEYNYVYNHTASGITTDRYSQCTGLIIRYNYCSNSYYYEYDVEHNATGTLIYGNVAYNGFFGYVIEGNNTSCYNNTALECEVGYTIQGNWAVAWNNVATDCTYGFINFYDAHGCDKSQATGNDTVCYDNIITGGNYSFCFFTGVDLLYSSNCTIYNNTMMGASNETFMFGEYTSYSYTGRGSLAQMWFTNMTVSTYNTTNFIINSTSPMHHLYSQNLTDDEFFIAVIWNSTNITYYQPSNWQNIRVQDITDNVFISWTEGSVIFGAEENHEYRVSNTPERTPPEPSGVSSLIPLVISVSSVIVVVGAIGYVVIKPFSGMTRRFGS